MSAAIQWWRASRGFRKGVRMERLTNSDKEIPTLVNNAEYWLEVYFKLKDIEDAEEQGLLLRLPCNEVWFICDKGTKYATVMSKSINDLTVYEIRKIDKDGRYWSSKKKAEAKLAEMEGAE
jgi:hypothetical protein